ncbi:guanylate kinase [Adlercreutzia sp. R21]|uniref:guanylate kinase n=1 Tax=Adlercreutzia wanghongyangiae TaxID=3111451 RepID=UPI002DB895E2|nr:guanylate kinase [Adlercreutzia sp. R21]MEC4184065.1 guanylate kinase [Adlercreutzia sp. R21]
MRTGNLFVISGPSGTGKGTIIARLVKEVPDAWVSVSATTRRPRPGEVEGVSYYFLPKDDFLALADEGGFLEWAQYSDNCYGTPLASVQREMAAGKQVILEIEVQGALQVKEKMPEAHLVFIEPPSLEELERRLRGRGTETDDVVRKRMDTALVELSHKMEYDIRLVNDDLDEAVAQLVAYVNETAEQK